LRTEHRPHSGYKQHPCAETKSALATQAAEAEQTKSALAEKTAELEALKHQLAAMKNP
jgi:hypothetical protein